MSCEVVARLQFVDLVLQRLCGTTKNFHQFLSNMNNSVNSSLSRFSAAASRHYPPQSDAGLTFSQPSIIRAVPHFTPVNKPQVLNNSLVNNSDNFHHRPGPSSLTPVRRLLDCPQYFTSSKRPARSEHDRHSVTSSSLTPPSTPSSPGTSSATQESDKIGSRADVSVDLHNNSDIRTSIKHEILRQLHVKGGSNTPVHSLEQRYKETPTRAQSIMQAKGIKRQLDVGGTPQGKRLRKGAQHGGTGSQNTFRDDWQYPNMSSPPTPLQSDPYLKASNCIWQYFLQNQQSPEMYLQKMALRDALFSVMRGVFPRCGLYVVGSSMNGFGSQISDMDLCLMISHSAIDQKKEATEVLRVLFKALKTVSFIKHPLFIKAKVPILKFHDRKSGIECDLNVNNSVGIRNTHLLNSYSKLDWRVRPLVLFIKHWAKTQEINDASKATISSYSLVLMIIHYLQYGCSPPVLPSLHQEFPYKFSKNMDVRSLSLNEPLPDYRTENKQSLGELFIGFLDYYTNRFDYRNEAISVRFGVKLPVDVVANQAPDLNPVNQWKFLNIEEPFDLSNTARSVYDGYIFQRVMHVFRVSHRKMAQTRDVYSVLRQPF